MSARNRRTSATAPTPPGLVIHARNAKGKLEPQSIELQLPPLARRCAVVQAWAQAGPDIQVKVLVMTAAIGLCCPAVQFKEDAPLYEHRILAYGEALYEYLRTRGAVDREIADAGWAAVQLCMDSIPTEAQQEEARGNSTAPSGT